ncbi:hypothetical protein [Streptomyces sp. NPDC098101]|uniref:hypothetical protein n=1 Tax=Streptomyces sp. NPDC098101 TaxID=3366096 RepID=UPI00380ADED2
MSITARNPRRTRLLTTLAGLAVTLLGGILWLIGDDNKATGTNRADMNSASTWGDVLGFDSDQDAAHAAAREQVDTGQTQMTAGTVLAVVGLALVGTRWIIRPATEK